MPTFIAILIAASCGNLESNFYQCMDPIDAQVAIMNCENEIIDCISRRTDIRYATAMDFRNCN